MNAKDFVRGTDFIKLMDADRVPLKFRLYYRLLWYSGFRPGEPLHFREMDLLRESIGIQTAYFVVLQTQKNQVEGEWVAIRPEEYHDLKDFYLLQHKDPSDYLFTGIRGKHTTQHMNAQFKRHCNIVGITNKYTLHSFKRGFVTRMHAKGWSYQDIGNQTRNINISILKKHYDKKIKHHSFLMITNQIQPKEKEI